MQLFDYLDKTNQSNSTICEILEELLGLSKSAVYKRIRGVKELSISEITKICEHFSLSLDQFMMPKYAHIGFGSDALRKKPNSYLDFVKNVRNHLDLLRGKPEVAFTFIAADMPLFHYFHFPILAQFKLFVWNNTVWKFGNENHFNPYNFEQDPELLRNIKEILELYYQYDGTEVWTERIFDASIQQIKYYLSTSSFSNVSHALEVFNALKKLRILLERIAEKGMKMLYNKHARLVDSGGHNTIFFNNLHTFNNSIQIRSAHFMITYLSMDTPNFLRCADPAFNRYTSEWVDVIKSKSVLISREGELDRKRYFKSIDAKLIKAEEEINLLIKGL
jgi:hypothetical protein